MQNPIQSANISSSEEHNVQVGQSEEHTMYRMVQDGEACAQGWCTRCHQLFAGGQIEGERHAGEAPVCKLGGENACEVSPGFWPWTYRAGYTVQVH